MANKHMKMCSVSQWSKVGKLKPEIDAHTWTSLVAQRLKPLPTMRETWIQSLGQEDPLEKEMATHSSIVARRIPWTEGPDGLQSMELQRVRHDWVTNTFTLTQQNAIQS